MATKRRKVWLQITTGADEGFCEEIRLKASASKEKGYAPFTERLPGDVVLSREEVDAIAGKLMDAKDIEYDPPSVRMYLNEALALLRGRR